MPIIKSAKKAARQADRRTLRNESIKKDIRSARKTLEKNPNFENYKKAQSELDKAVKKNLIKKNTASRRKSALAKLAKSLGVKIEASKKPAAKPATKPAAKPAAKPATKPAAKSAAKPAAKPAAKKAPKAKAEKSSK